MKVLLQVGRPRQEKSSTTRYAPSDLAHCFVKLVPNASPVTSGRERREKSPTTRHDPDDLAHYVLNLITNEIPTPKGAPTTREEPNYKTFSQ